MKIKVKWEFLGMNNEFCEIIKKFLDDSHTKKLISLTYTAIRSVSMN